MRAVLTIGAAVFWAIGCGEKPRHNVFDGGEDAGFDAGVDAGRPRGDDPPPGYSNAVEQPRDAGTTRVGVSVSLALDQHDQPMVAYVHEDPNDDGVPQDGRIVFTRWNGVDKRWQEPKTVETVGQIDTAAPHRQVSLARDSSTGRIGVAYVTSGQQVRFAVSTDEGELWSIETVSQGTPTKVSNPSLAMAGGTLYLAWHQDGTLVFASRLASAAPGAWSRSTVAPPSGSSSVRDGPVSLAIDASGSPGVAFVTDSAIAFARPGAPATSAFTDTAMSAPSVSLAFKGEVPVLAFHVTHERTYVRYVEATDSAGTAWRAPIMIPSNSSRGDEHTAYFQAIVSMPTSVVVAANRLPGGLTQCGGPKLARSSDGVSFSVCSPDNGTYFGEAGLWVSLATTRAGKLYMAFRYASTAHPDIRGGVIVWREP